MINRPSLLGACLAIGSLLSLTESAARAEVRLPALFSDNAVLQQGLPLPVWGWADEGEQVTVRFRDQTVTTMARDGKWMVRLAAVSAGGGPDTLTVTGQNTLTVKNVLIGEVWLCSGQSNMEFPLGRSFESGADVTNSVNPNIRLFHVPKLKAEGPVTDVKATWREAGPDSVRNFSAVGYYFGRDLEKARHVPVGMIESDWGGSPAEVWMKRTVLEANPRYITEILEKYLEDVKRYHEAHAAFEKSSAENKAAGKPVGRVPNPPAWRPTELYNGMIAPLIPYALKGALWYQGEANAGRAEQYRTLFADMIRNWRTDWAQGDFTFLTVQLAPFNPIKPDPAESTWAELREAQLLSTKVLPNAGMAVITDVGDPKDIHPTRKQPVGARLALAARGIAYGENIVYSGPVYKSMEVRDHQIALHFDHVGAGLEAREGALKGFAICGEDHKFVWADAIISGNEILVSHATVEKPVAVRYGWADCPVVNLWNKDGLPATPFRTDDFPMITAPKK